MPKLKIDLDIAAEQMDNIHGRHDKIGVVLHETVSANHAGLDDIRAVSSFLDVEDFGIYGITDADGNIAAARGLGRSIFFHTKSQGSKGDGLANTNYIGIEQISRVMLDFRTQKARLQAWLLMKKELNATAKLLACLSRAHGFDLIDNHGDTRRPGVTTHWEVTDFFGVPGGHVDCWPVHRGGYYPKGHVLALARCYRTAGWHF